MIRKSLTTKRGTKVEKEQNTLFSLIDLFLQTGAPIGSNTLKNSHLQEISSATIRNYFAKLEKEGMVLQLHGSSGRIPTEKALRAYVDSDRKSFLSENIKKKFEKELDLDGKEVSKYLQHALSVIEKEVGLPLFLSAPRFDHDFVSGLRLTPIDESRAVVIITTDFGQIYTEIVSLPHRLSDKAARHLEEIFALKLKGESFGTETTLNNPLAEKIYNEVMLRHIVSYSNFRKSDILRSGFANLLKRGDLNSLDKMAEALSLFENSDALERFIQKSSLSGKRECWIGSEISAELTDYSIITVPYRINQSVVGSIGLLGPLSINYFELFELFTFAAECISKNITKNIYKFKISYRQPDLDPTSLYLTETRLIALENNPQKREINS